MVNHHINNGTNDRPTPDALVALRNWRLWDTHAQRTGGAERERARRLAHEWSTTFAMLMATSPGDRPVPTRRGEHDGNRGHNAYLVFTAIMFLALAIWLIYKIAT